MEALVREIKERLWGSMVIGCDLSFFGGSALVAFIYSQAAMKTTRVPGPVKKDIGVPNRTGER